INDNVYLPSRVEAQVLAPSDFRRDALRPNWRMTSFTGITAGRHSETPDYDSVDQAQREELPGNTIFTFPRGPLPGICLHSVFEEWPFDCTDLAALKALVQSKLKTYAIADSWTDIVADTVHATLQARLSPDGLKLAGLGARQKLMEMEFTYPLHDVSVASLQALLAAPVHRIDVLFTVACRQLRFERIEGFMKGFIDLVFQADGRFYLVDYKSNWLGNRAEDYVPERLKQAIAQHHYYLQYLIYSLALHRYLASRMPHYSYERHFGGVYYLFLRGIDAAVPGNGIFFERPENSLIRALDDLIANKEAAP
ncbi:MAG: PD-(D/E)XK nuclease family protein, partial [Pseudomonadota bacterium]